MTLSNPMRFLGCGVATLLIVAGCTSTNSTSNIPTGPATTPSPSVQQVSTAHLEPASTVKVTPGTKGGQPTAGDPSASTAVAQSNPQITGNATASVAQVPTAPSELPSDAQQEAVDRAAIEAQWASFWTTYNGMVRLPEGERSHALIKSALTP